MRNPSLYGNCKKLFYEFGGPANYFCAKLGGCFFIQHRRRGEDPATFSAESVHKGTVIELSDDARLKLMFVKPVVKLLANG